MNDDVKTGFEMPKPDMGIGKVNIGGDAKPIPETKKANPNATHKCILGSL